MTTARPSKGLIRRNSTPTVKFYFGPLQIHWGSMGHYQPNVRDLEFNLCEVLELEKTLATGDFGTLAGAF